MKRQFIKFVSILFISSTLLLMSSKLICQGDAFIRGVDGSVLDEVEQSGGLYYDDGVQKGALEIFKKYGANLIRLKLWHTPENQYNSLQRVEVIAQRAKALGMQFMLDIHYSDTWADAGHQAKPAAWEGLSFDVLSDSVFTYTKNVIASLKTNNTLPDYVQIGNEISCGMLYDDGKICGEFATPEQWQKFGLLLKSAINGMYAALDQGEEIKTIIHFDNGGNNVGCQWFFDNMVDQGVSFDIIGLSYYPWWHGTITQLANNLNDLAVRYGKDLMVVENAYPWTLQWGDNTFNPVGSQDQLLNGYPATVAGQKKFITDVITTIQTTSDNKGTGYVYWSPEWIPGHPGSPWENLALFDFEGNALESMRALNSYAGIHNELNNNEIDHLNISPNPFSHKVSINFSLKEKQYLTVTITDTFGKQILNPLKDEILNKGKHALNIETAGLVPGMYFITIRGAHFYRTVKAIKID